MKEFVIQRYRADASAGTGRQTLLRIDDEGKVLFADNNAEAVLGYDANELEGIMVHQVLASREDDPFAPVNRHRIESGQNALVTFRHKEGFSTPPAFHCALVCAIQTKPPALESLNRKALP